MRRRSFSGRWYSQAASISLFRSIEILSEKFVGRELSDISYTRQATAGSHPQKKQPKDKTVFGSFWETQLLSAAEMCAAVVFSFILLYHRLPPLGPSPNRAELLLEYAETNGRNENCL